MPELVQIQEDIDSNANIRLKMTKKSTRTNKLVRLNLK